MSSGSCVHKWSVYLNVVIAVVVSCSANLAVTLPPRADDRQLLSAQITSSQAQFLLCSTIKYNAKLMFCFIVVKLE